MKNIFPLVKICRTRSIMLKVEHREVGKKQKDFLRRKAFKGGWSIDWGSEEVNRFYLQKEKVDDVAEEEDVPNNKNRNC